MTVNGSVPLLGRELRVVVPPPEMRLLSLWAKQENIGISEAAGRLLILQLREMAGRFAFEREAAAVAGMIRGFCGDLP